MRIGMTVWVMCFTTYLKERDAPALVGVDRCTYRCLPTSKINLDDRCFRLAFVGLLD